MMANGQAVAQPQDPATPEESQIVGPPTPGPAVPAVAQYVYVPMTTKQKLSWTVGCIVDPTWIINSAARAGLDQWRNGPSTWGQGAEGYARRFGAAHELEAFEDAVWFAGSALDHEDPRYLRSGRSGFLPRLTDSLKVAFLSRRDNGSIGFAYARTVAGLGTEMVEGVVFPDEEPFTTGNILTSALRYVGLREALSVGREFLPDVFRRVGELVRDSGIPLTTPIRPLPPSPPRN